MTVVIFQAAEIEAELGVGGFVKPKAVGLDDEEDEEDDDVDGQLQKWDEGEVKVDQDDELAIRMFMKPPSKVDDNCKARWCRQS